MDKTFYDIHVKYKDGKSSVLRQCKIEDLTTYLKAIFLVHIKFMPTPSYIEEISID